MPERSGVERRAGWPGIQCGGHEALVKAINELTVEQANDSLNTRWILRIAAGGFTVTCLLLGALIPIAWSARNQSIENGRVSARTEKQVEVNTRRIDRLEECLFPRKPAR